MSSRKSCYHRRFLMKEGESRIIAASLQRQNVTLGGFITKAMMQKLFLGHVNI